MNETKKDEIIKDGRRCFEESIDATEKNISLCYFQIFHHVDIASLDMYTVSTMDDVYFTAPV